MAEPARDDDNDLTAEERAQIRALLRLLRKASGAPVDAPRQSRVVQPPAPKFDPDEYVMKLRRRKGLRNG